MAERTIPQKVQDNAQRLPGHAAYQAKRGGAWVPTSWSTYAEEVRQAGKALLALGLQHGGVVNIIGFNRPEWVIMDVAAMSVGGVPAGIYTTNSPDECKYILNHSEALVLLAEDEHQWHKINTIRDQLPYLKKVVMMADAPVIEDDLVVSWEEFMALGDTVADEEFDRRLEALSMDDLATMIYTSGTTGPPKAVMLSHRNLAWTAETGTNLFHFKPEERSISYLPLSHIAEQMFTIHIPTTAGSTVYFAESIDKMPDNLKEVKPTYFAAVPRVWEKFYAAVKPKLEEAHGIRKTLAEWALGVGRKVAELSMRGKQPSGLLAAQFQVADKLVLSKIRDAMGFGDLQVAVTAAAPISTEILEFFAPMFIIYEIYGQSEDTGPTTLNYPGKVKFGSVGVPYPGTEVKLAEDDEILVRGPHVFMGYYKDEEATKETVIDGWLHSGDLGKFDEEGFLWITGRKKDIIITAGGKNVAPAPMETALKNHPFVADAVVIGDRRKYLVALISLDQEAVDAFLEERGLEGPAHEVPLVRDSIQLAIDELNIHLARVEQIKKFAILPRPLSIDGGELTPTLKVKRRVVEEHFADIIESLYED